MAERPPLTADDPWLQRVTGFCLALPETTRDLGADQASFRVRKKVFAYCLHDHHHDGNIAVCASRQPDLYYLPSYIGNRGWFGMRLKATPDIEWGMVASILKLSYEVVAPSVLSKNL